MDGTRAMLVKKADGSISIPNRRAVDYAQERNLPELTEILSLFPNDTSVDGEVVAFDKKGKIDRIMSQRRCGTTLPYRVAFLKTQIPVFFYAFDILRLSGKDFETKPYLERKAVLDDFVATILHSNFKYLCYQRKDFRQLFDSELEGIMVNSGLVGEFL